MFNVLSPSFMHQLIEKTLKFLEFICSYQRSHLFTYKSNPTEQSYSGLFGLSFDLMSSQSDDYYSDNLLY